MQNKYYEVNRNLNYRYIDVLCYHETTKFQSSNSTRQCLGLYLFFSVSNNDLRPNRDRKHAVGKPLVATSSETEIDCSVSNRDYVRDRSIWTLTETGLWVGLYLRPTDLVSTRDQIHSFSVEVHQPRSLTAVC